MNINKNYKLLFISLLVSIIKPLKCARILGVFPIAAPSHQILDSSLMRGLANAGHDVTVISPFENKIPVHNGSYTDVILTGYSEDFQAMLKKMDVFQQQDVNMFTKISLKFQSVQSLARSLFNHPKVQKLLKTDQQFDLVIVEYFLNEILSYFSHHYQAPLIYLSTTGNPGWVNPMVGNPNPVAYLPYLLGSYSQEMDFFERLHNSLQYLYHSYVNNYISIPEQTKVLKQIFPNAPDVKDLYGNLSLVLVNSHVSLNQAFPTVPNMVEIGGYHITPPKKLPNDLQEILDNAEHGVVYFSLGSNAQSKNMPREKRVSLLKAFGKLKEIVLWKWEDESLPEKPSNVVIRKWLPQNDILAHPNIKLFITHGGQLSSTETVYHGVPALMVPLFADQYVNAKQAELNGYAISLPFHDDNFTEQKLSELLEELLRNPEYRQEAKKKSKIFHDRPLKPMENAIFWVEYVIRHEGADHLKVAGVKMPWYKYLLVDIVAFLVGCVLLVILFLYFIVNRIIHRKKGSKKTKVS